MKQREQLDDQHASRESDVQFLARVMLIREEKRWPLTSSDLARLRALATERTPTNEGAKSEPPSPIPEGAEEFVFDDGRRALLRVNDSGEVEAVMLDGDSFAETDGGVVVTELNIGLQNAMLSLRAKWATMQEPERVEVRGYQQGREYVLRMKRRDLELMNNLANGTDNALSVAVLNQLQQMSEGEGLVPSEDKPSTDGDALGEPYRVVGPMHFKREPKNDYPEDCQLESGKVLEFYTREQVEAERARNAEALMVAQRDAERLPEYVRALKERDTRIAELEGALTTLRGEFGAAIQDGAKAGEAALSEKARADKLAEELERVRASAYVRPELLWFSRWMEKKLRENDHNQ